MLDLFSEPDIFGILWDAESRHNGMTYPPLPDIYAPAMNVSPLCPDISYRPLLMVMPATVRAPGMQLVGKPFYVHRGQNI